MCEKCAEGEENACLSIAFGVRKELVHQRPYNRRGQREIDV